MTKKTLTAKLSPKNLNRLEDYADREGISKSEATDRLVKQGLDVEESDMRLVPVRSDGGTIIEDRLDEIEKRQQEQFESTQDKIENSIDKTLYEDILDKTVTWSFGLLFTGLIIGLLSSLGYTLGIDPELVTVYLFTVSVVFVSSKGLQDVIA